MAPPKLKKTSLSPPHQHFGYKDDDARAAIRATRFVSARTNHSSPRSTSSPSRLHGSEDSQPFSSVHDKRYVSLANNTVLPSQTSSKQTWIHDNSTTMPFRGPRNDRSTKQKGTIRSHLKRSNHNDKTSIDLDRSALENEGLGIYTNLDRDRRYGDIAASRRTGRSSHNRSTSGTSQFSATTSSTTHKPGSQYVHPMRLTPRPYTPPISQSYQNSVLESEHSTDAGQFSTDLDDATSVSRDFAPTSETQPYQIHTTSFANISAPVLANHTRGSHETPSPLSRNSLEFSFRSRTRTNTDPAARVAAVEAARQAFEDKEAAKQRKLEKQSMKAQDREIRRQEKKEQHLNSLSTAASLRRRSNEKRNSSEGRGSGRKSMNEKRDNATADYDYTHGNRSRPFESPKSTWVLFITWLRTKLFKMGRKLSVKKKS